LSSAKEGQVVAERFEQVVAHLEQARARWVVMHDHYVRFCERSMDMADAGCGAKGIIPKWIGDDLYVQYLDRRLRISFGFDRISDRGILCVDDLSAVGLYDGRNPVRIETILFSGDGDLDVVDADGASLSLSDPAYAIQLALGIVDAAIDQNPWKVS
jgi:hypothetical protein